MFRVLLIGNLGQLGWELERALATRCDLVAVDYPAIDLASEKSIKRTIKDYGEFRVIINAAAYTDVDKAEKEESLAMAVNAEGPGILAREAKNMGAALIHYSTDYVFDGTKGRPYIETDQPNPLNVYGKSKLAGEKEILRTGVACLIFRTAWVYSLRRESFVTKVLRWAKEKETLKIVADQISNPTWAHSLATASVRILLSQKNELNNFQTIETALFHLAGEGYVSRFDWAKEILRSHIFRYRNIEVGLMPAASTEFYSPAIRPTFSALNCHKFLTRFGFQLPNWKTSLQHALEAFE